MEKNSIETRCAKVSWDSEGFVRAVFKPQAEVSLEDSKEITQARVEVTENNKHAILFDIRSIKYASKESRKYAASEEVSGLTIALALLVDSPVSKIVGNFFTGLNKPSYPTKLFTSEREAVEWLKEYKGI